MHCFKTYCEKKSREINFDDPGHFIKSKKYTMELSLKYFHF